MANSRRRRNPHPGVSVIKPSGRHTSYRLRWRSADDGKLQSLKLDPLRYPTLETRQAVAILKARELAKRKAELSDDNAIRRDGKPLTEAFSEFFQAKRDLRDSTLEGYRKRADAFVAWGQATGVLSLDDITRPRLLEYRDAVVSEPSSRGDGTRSKHFVNRVLRETSVPLHWMHERRMLPACSADDLKIGLKRVRASVDRPHILSGSEPGELLRVALADDKRRPRGEPIISPFILTLLLSGFRMSECLTLTHDALDLDALNHDGTKCGQAYLSSEQTKTHTGRVVSFDISPSLRDLFLALKTADHDRVFHGLSRSLFTSRCKALRKNGAPAFSPQTLRRTCGSNLTCAPGIYGSASAFMSAKRLGHSVAVSERFYADAIRGIPKDAVTLEQAMGIEGEAAAITKYAKERRTGQAVD